MDVLGEMSWGMSRPVRDRGRERSISLRHPISYGYRIVRGKRERDGQGKQRQVSEQATKVPFSLALVGFIVS